MNSHSRRSRDKPFVTATRTVSPLSRLGFSLCAVALAATSQGGTISITSEVGAGTNVNIYLPVEARSTPWPVTEGSDERPHLDRG